MKVYFEDTKPVKIKNVATAKEYEGKKIAYLRECDIDKSGRGYYFMRYMTVAKVVPQHFIDEYGSYLFYRDIARLSVID